MNCEQETCSQKACRTLITLGDERVEGNVLRTEDPHALSVSIITVPSEIHIVVESINHYSRPGTLGESNRGVGGTHVSLKTTIFRYFFLSRGVAGFSPCI